MTQIPQLYPSLPTLAGDDAAKLRAVLRLLSRYGLVDEMAQDALARLASIRDDNGLTVFSDPSPTAPENVLAKQLAHITALGVFYASNIPLLLEDYLLALSGEQPAEGAPEYVWVVHRLTAPRNADYTIPVGREMRSEQGQAYVAVTAVKIPAGKWGDEVGVDGRLLYEQLYRARVSGIAQRVAPFTLTVPTSSIAYVDHSTNRRSSFAGRDPESFEEFRVRAFQTPLDKLLVTPEDFVRATTDFLGPRARAVVVGRVGEGGLKMPNTIQIAALDPNGDVVSPDNGGLALVDNLNSRTVDAEIILTVPVFTEINLTLSVILESGSLLDDAQVKAVIEDQISLLTSPLRWADWGEEENQFSAVRLAGQLTDNLPGVDRIKITALGYVSPTGGLRSVSVGDDVALAPVIGLPRITLGGIAVMRERSS